MGESEVFLRSFHHPLLVVKLDSPHANIGDSDVVDFRNYAVAATRFWKLRRVMALANTRDFACGPFDKIRCYSDSTCGNVGSAFN